MELKLKLKIENLYGGDGITRPIEVKQKTFSRTKGKKTTKLNLGVSTSSGVDEEQYETKHVDVQTFQFVDGNPVMRLGGIHGKLWGHLRASGKMLADLGELDSKAGVDRMMMSVNLTPVNVVIKNHKAMQVAEIPQITAGLSKALIIQKFDFLPECEVEMTMIFPDMYKEQILKILKHSEQTGGLNKRRATITILNREILK